MKSKTSFGKGKARPSLDRLIGGTYPRIHNSAFKKNVGPVTNSHVVDRPFLNVLLRPHEKIFYVILKGVRHPFGVILEYFLFCKAPWSLTLDLAHTKTLCFGQWTANFLGRVTYTMLSRKLHLHPFSPSNLTATFSSVSSNENTWKDSLVGLSNLSLVLGMICANKNVHRVMQHPSLGSMT